MGLFVLKTVTSKSNSHKIQLVKEVVIGQDQILKDKGSE